MRFIEEAFETNWVAPLGNNVDCFETEMAQTVGVSSGAACVSGTSALFLAYKLAGVKPGDKVLCSDLTFSATVNPIVYLGGEPILVDSEESSWNMSPEALEEGFRKYPECKVVGLVHLYGVPAMLDEIRDVCRRHNAVLVEDAAEALGAVYKGRLCGSYGDYAALSFNGNKIITTSGGGMLLTNDPEAAKKARFWSTQSREPVLWYEHKELGFNFRMSNVCAGIGRGQLLHLQEHVERKMLIHDRYLAAFKELPLAMSPHLPGTQPNFWLSVAMLHDDVKATPLEICRHLKEHNVEARPIWKPMHMQPLYANNDFISTGVGERVFARGLCLPSDIKMTEDEQESVVRLIAECLK